MTSSADSPEPDSQPLTRPSNSSPQGGPKTDAGKLASRQNARKHGLTARTLLPRERIDTLRGALMEQYLPANPTEQILVDEVARHAAMLEMSELAEGAVLRHGGRELSRVIFGTGYQPSPTSAEGASDPTDPAVPADPESYQEDPREDALLSAAVSTDALDKFNRYRRCHEKALHTALDKLQEVQVDRHKRELEQAAAPRASTRVTLPPSCGVSSSVNNSVKDSGSNNAGRTVSNATESAGSGDSSAETSSAGTGSVGTGERWTSDQVCEDVLKKRFFHDHWCCPHCEHAQGSWLDKRSCWECYGCKKQIGLRYGTVLHRSRLPVRIWFRAIDLVLADPEVSRKTLAAALGLTRLPTVGRLLKAIHEALASDDAHARLAGLARNADVGPPPGSQPNATAP